MKKFLLTVACCLSALLPLQAQSTHYGTWEWDVLRLGILSPGLDVHRSGLLAGSELRRNLSDAVSVSVRGEGGMVSVLRKNGSSVGAAFYMSVVGLADRYFGTPGRTRFFAGGGTGFFYGERPCTDGADCVNSSTGFLQSGFETYRGVGAVLRVGTELNHWRLTTELNHPLAKRSPSFVAFQMAYTIGGGYR